MNEPKFKHLFWHIVAILNAVPRIACAALDKTEGKGEGK